METVSTYEATTHLSSILQLFERAGTRVDFIWLAGEVVYENLRLERKAAASGDVDHDTRAVSA